MACGIVCGLGPQFFFPVFLSQTDTEQLLSSARYKGEKFLLSSCFNPVEEAGRWISEDRAACFTL